MTIKTATASAESEMLSNPKLKTELLDVTKRLLELKEEEKYLKEKVALFEKAGEPYVLAYAQDEEKVNTIALEVNQLKAQAKLYSAQV